MSTHLTGYTVTAADEVIAFNEDGRTNVSVRSLFVFDGDQRIARLKLETDGVCNDVWVANDYRRNGIATAMWAIAEELLGIRPRHSTNRTPEGEAWAQSLGEKLPERSVA